MLDDATVVGMSDAVDYGDHEACGGFVLVPDLDCWCWRRMCWVAAVAVDCRRLVADQHQL